MACKVNLKVDYKETLKNDDGELVMEKGQTQVIPWFLLTEEITILRFWRNEMRKCIRCDRDMLEDYDVKVEGGAYGLKVKNPGNFFGSLGKVRCAVCSECGYLEFYLADISKFPEEEK